MKDKGSGIDYGKLTAEALNAHYKAQRRAQLQSQPLDKLTSDEKAELEELLAADNSKS
jgi:methylase of polypeptide subunit release factors